MTEKWDNHGIPDHYDNYVVKVTLRGKYVYFFAGLNRSPATYEPFREYGMDIFLREEWTDAIKVVFDFDVTPEMRGKILRELRKKLYPTAKFFKHVPYGKEVKNGE